MDQGPIGRWTGRLRPIAWLRDHPRAADLLLATTLTILALTAHLAKVEEQDASDNVDPAWWTVLIVVASVFPVAWRRSHTIGVAAFVVTSQIVAELADVGGSGFIGVVVAIYSLGAHSEGPARSRLLLLIAISLGALFIAGLLYDDLDLGSLVASTVVLVTTFVVGDNLRRRRDSEREAEQRALRAERERELIAKQQLNAERSRIARELHDVVAHSVSVMVIQAAAARRSLESSPDSARQALTNIEETGRQTMTELRGILGVLRRSGPTEEVITDPGLEPQPTLDQVADLVRLADDLPIDLTVDGDLSGLPNSVSLTGYRLVQEAFTNIRRHAGPVTRVLVTISRQPTEVVIEITDDGRGAAADQTDPGYGLLGMSERVVAIGGRLGAGSRVGGGWRIAASLPLSPHRPRTQVGAPTDPDDAPAFSSGDPHTAAASTDGAS